MRELRGELGRRLCQVHRDLMAVTVECSDEMHEPPDGLKVRLVGDHLDNACGSHVGVERIVRGGQEFVLCFEWFNGREFVYQQINLADLIALARVAVDEPCAN